MAKIREIRDRIVSVKSTQQITRAMKLVAAAKLKKAQDRLVALRPYAADYLRLFTNLVYSGSPVHHPFLTAKKPGGNIGLLVVSSDRGLCGGFNNNLFREIENFIHTNFPAEKASGKIKIIAVGRKSVEYFSRRNYDVVAKHPGFFDRLKYDRLLDVAGDVVSLFSKEDTTVVYLAYNEFKTVISQNRVVKQLLPVEPPKQSAKEKMAAKTEYIIEPGANEVMKTVAPQYLNTIIWRAVLESNASEQGARMAAMESATENAQELVRQLSLKYNQARQAAITTEISEIVSGADALGG
jgi:F-type H+-transporting ATPase subunit gamma